MSKNPYQIKNKITIIILLKNTRKKYCILSNNNYANKQKTRYFFYFTKNKNMTNPVIEKYSDVIKEEVNVKEINELDIDIKPVFKPLGNKLSAKFGKDTGNIIRFGKMGNIEKLENGQVKVFDDSTGENKNERILDAEDYEIAYEGLNDKKMAADGDIIVDLDLELTEELKQEWVAREISRFLNQMRKEADYPVDAKVVLSYETTNENFKNILSTFNEFLCNEALLSEITANLQDGDITSIFNLDEHNITFSMKK